MSNTSVNATRCVNCVFFAKLHIDGKCTNPRNAEIKYVGGGGEYSSSEQCMVPPTVWEIQRCDLFEAGKRGGNIQPVPVDLRQKRWEEESKRYLHTTRSLSPLEAQQGLNWKQLLGDGK